MATIFLDSGTDATQDMSTFLATTTTNTGCTSATDQPFKGLRALKLTMASADIDLECAYTVLADAGRRVSFWFRFSNLTIGINTIFQFQTSGSLAVYRVQLNTNGTIRSNPPGATATDGTTVLAVDTWHRVSISYTITNTTTFRFDLRVNGILEASSTAGTLTRTATAKFRIRSQTASASSGHAYWYKHFYIDDIADYSDPGEIYVAHKRPYGNGDVNQWTTQIGSGGSGYGFFHAPQVNEQPMSQTNGWSIQSASLLTEQYEIETLAAGDTNIAHAVIVDLGGWMRVSCGVASTGNFLMDNGVSVSSLPQTFPTTAAILRMYVGSTIVAYGSATAIGADNNSVNQLFSLYECGVFVAYREASFVPRLRPMTPFLVR